MFSASTSRPPAASVDPALPSNPVARHLRRSVTAVPTALSVVLAAGTVSVWLGLLMTPHRIERVEIHVRTLVLWWRQGVLPYVPADAWPIVQNPYGPVYLGLLAWLPDLGPYGAGRLISLLATLGCLAGVAGWLRCRAKTGPGPGTDAAALLGLAALLPLTTKPFLLFAPLFRVDALALWLTSLGFFLATAPPRPESRPDLSTRRWMMASACFLAAFATKLTFIAAPAACALWWWLTGRRHQAAGFFTTFGVGAVAWVVGMEWATGGRYLASAAVGNLPTAPLKSLDMLARTGQWLFWWLAAAVLAGWRRRSAVGIASLHRVLRRSPAACYLLTSLGTAAAFAANPLSSWNYLLEPCLALALLTGDLWRTATAPQRRLASRLLIAHLLVASIGWVSWSHDWRRDIAHHADALASVDPELEARSREDPRGAVVDSEAAQDLLAIRGIPPWLAAPDAVAALPEVRRRLRRGLATGELAWVVYGETLTEPTSCSSSRAGGADASTDEPGDAHPGACVLGDRSDSRVVRNRTSVSDVRSEHGQKETSTARPLLCRDHRPSSADRGRGVRT